MFSVVELGWFLTESALSVWIWVARVPESGERSHHNNLPTTMRSQCNSDTLLSASDSYVAVGIEANDDLLYCGQTNLRISVNLKVITVWHWVSTTTVRGKSKDTHHAHNQITGDLLLLLLFISSQWCWWSTYVIIIPSEFHHCCSRPRRSGPLPQQGPLGNLPYQALNYQIQS